MTKPKKKPTKRRKIKVEPSTEHPMPYDDAPQVALTSMEELQTLADTGDALQELGAIPEVDEKTLAAEKKLIEQAASGKNVDQIGSLPASVGAKIFLERYGKELGHDYNVVRGALTNKMLELADNEDPKVALKAIELLGKHSDIALFTERTEHTVNFNTPEALESAIKDRLKRLMKAKEQYQLPNAAELEEEAKVLDILDAEYEEVEAENEE